jgi:hypothetical protein
MNALRRNNFAAFCDAVHKYQRQIAPTVGTESTLVPLARMDEFSRLLVHRFLPVLE